MYLKRTTVGHTPSRGRPFQIIAALVVVGFLLAAMSGSAQSLQDLFANRVTIFTANGQIETNNSGATLEPGEPKHGGKTGGHSMWISWVAPAHGVVRFKTEGSSFDTLLSAYRFASANDTDISQLIRVADADDSEGIERESEIEFGALAGQRYEIAVAGYADFSGQLEFSWEFAATTIPPPVTLSTPADFSANLGDTVSLTVGLSNVLDGVQFKWYFNGNELNAATTNLTLGNFNAAKVGRYKMRIRVDGQNYFVMPTEIQINTDGVSNALARSKVLDTPESALGIQGGGGAAALARGLLGAGVNGVVRGYNGSQIFNTTYATIDTNEPPHCGFSGGSSYWLSYQPPTNGTLTLTTAGSTYDTVMEVYTYDGALLGYSNLISIACDHNSLGGTNGASRIECAVVKTRRYVVAVEGVNNSQGTAWLNYSLTTNQLPTPPMLLSAPAAVTVGEGSPATLAANLAGAPPLRFGWKKNSLPLPGETAASLFFASTVVADTANYVLTVTNDLGTLSATLPLHVVERPVSTLMRVGTDAQLTFQTVNGLRYTVEEAATVSGPWVAWPNFYPGNGSPQTVYLTTGGEAKFFRIRIE